MNEDILGTTPIDELEMDDNDLDFVENLDLELHSDLDGAAATEQAEDAAEQDLQEVDLSKMNKDYTLDSTPINEPEMGENDVKNQEYLELEQDSDLEGSAATGESVEAPTEDIPEVDLSDFCPAQSTSSTQIAGEAGVLSIINSQKNGKRLMFSYDLMAHLNQPDRVKIAFHEGNLAITEQLPTNGHAFLVKKSKRKGTVYSSALVEEITKKFGLDFTNRVSITFHECRYGQFNGFPVAVIEISR